MQTFTKDEIQKILENHVHWLNEDCDGWEEMRADLRGADLYGADLRGANFSGANLRGADLYGADLRGANLRGANLRGANFYGADLRGADLYGADLRGAKNVPFVPMACPEEGEFIGWKKCIFRSETGLTSCIVKLLIPQDAKRSSATGRKCRCDMAKVIVIESLDGSEQYESAMSCHDSTFIYKVGETVKVDDFDDDRFKECAPGIHFFINRQEAVDYEF